MDNPLFWVLVGTFGGAIVLIPLGWALWTIHLSVKHRKMAEDSVLATFLTAGSPIHAVCEKRGYKVIPPEDVIKRISESLKDGKDGGSKKTPRYFMYSDEAKILDLFPFDRRKAIQAVIPRLFYKPPNAAPLNPNQDFIPAHTDAMIGVIQDEKSADAMMRLMERENTDAKRLEIGIENMVKGVKTLTIIMVIVGVLVIGLGVITFLGNKEASIMAETIVKIQGALGVK